MLVMSQMTLIISPQRDFVPWAKRPTAEEMQVKGGCVMLAELLFFKALLYFKTQDVSCQYFFFPGSAI